MLRWVQMIYDSYKKNIEVVVLEVQMEGWRSLENKYNHYDEKNSLSQAARLIRT